MSLRNLHRNPGGYTLIEILVVIVIIGLLTSMATVSYSRAQLTARDNTRKTNVINLAHAVEQYYSVNKKLPGKINTTLNGGIPTGYNNCENLDWSNYVYRYKVTTENSTGTNIEKSCNNKQPYNIPTASNNIVPPTATNYTFDPNEWKPFPVWIPGLGSFINPFPIESSLVDGDPLSVSAARTYAYRHLTDGYLVYTALEATAKTGEDKNQYKSGDMALFKSTCDKYDQYGVPQITNSQSVIYAICK